MFAIKRFRIQMEVYAFLALVGLGTLFSQNAKVWLESMNPGSGGNPRLLETGADKNSIDAVQRDEYARAHLMAQAAKDPLGTGVVSRNENVLQGHTVKPVFSDVTSADIGRDRMRNPQPFYGSRVKHHTSERMNEGYLNFSDVHATPKREVESFFAPNADARFIPGGPTTDSEIKKRMELVPTFNNHLPFDQVRVGPGVGQGYGSSPAGGLQQGQDRDYLMPMMKNVDDLRPLVKQKSTYGARVIQGSTTQYRGLAPEFAKNRPDTVFDSGDRGLLATRAGIEGRTSRPDTRHAMQENFVEGGAYVGPMGSSSTEALPSRGDYELRDRRLPQDGLAMGPVARAGHSYETVAPVNRRDVRSEGLNERSSGASVVSYLGPAEGSATDPDIFRPDALRLSGREELQHTKRLYGNMSLQAPGFGPNVDESDAPRSTIRETLIHAPRSGSVGGQNFGEAYANAFDGDTRVPVRNNVQSEFIAGNMKSVHSRPQTYSYDPVRSTIKDTTLSSHLGNACGSGPEGPPQGGAPEATITNRELSHVSYSGPRGSPSMNVGGHSQIQEAHLRSIAPVTAREMSHVESYGFAGSVDKKPMSYEALYNETIRTVKDEVSRGRLLGAVGANSGANLELLGNQRPPPTHVNTSRVEAGGGQLSYNARGAGFPTSAKPQTYANANDDKHILDYLRSNPFVVGLGASKVEPGREVQDPSRAQRIA